MYKDRTDFAPHMYAYSSLGRIPERNGEGKEGGNAAKAACLGGRDSRSTKQLILSLPGIFYWARYDLQDSRHLSRDATLKATHVYQRKLFPTFARMPSPSPL